MLPTHRALKISVYLNEGDQWHHRPLYLELLELFKREGCSGATVLRAIGGFTASGSIQTQNQVAPARLPLVIEMIESQDRVLALLPKVRDMVDQRLVTVQEVYLA